MSEGLAGVVLAAGLGTRLRPLTLLRPKALCPVANVALVDLAVERVATATEDIAVNLHHGRAALDVHLAPSIHRSMEERPLGTAGALGRLRGWVDGRGVLVVNADTWCPGSLAGFVAGWDAERIRLLVAGEEELHPTSRIAAALMPWADVASLSDEPSGLYETSWRAADAAGRVDVVRHDGPFVDCGTPEQYLAANLAASGGASVIGERAVIDGTLERSVVWPGAIVHRGESLSGAIRADRRITVLVRH